MKKACSLIMTIVFFLTLFPAEIFAQSTSLISSAEGASALIDYSEYMKSCESLPYGEKDIVINDSQLLQNGDEIENGALLISEGKTANISFKVAQAGRYELSFTYMAKPGRSSSPQTAISINNSVLFKEAASVVLTRRWYDGVSKIEQDENGNDIRPTQKEYEQWYTQSVSDNSGYNMHPFLFYFDKGENTVSLTQVRENLLLKQLTLKAVQQPISYESYITSHANKPLAQQNAARIQGETPAWKTHPTLIAASDRTSPLTEPYHGTKTSLNVIGANTSWDKPSELIAWEVNVPQSAMYEIRFRVRQNYLRGAYSGRRLKVDGEVPFAEAEDIHFNYDSRWQITTFGGSSPYYVYLEKGTHELSLEAVLGNLSAMIGRVDNCTNEIREIHRRFLMILGCSPDTMRDYKLEKQLPEEFLRMSEIAQQLESIVEEMAIAAGSKGTALLPLTKMAVTLKDFVEKPYNIPSKLNTFSSNLSSLDAWKMESSTRPLELDYIDVAAPNSKLPMANANVFDNVLHGTKMFLSSFVTDYDNFSSNKSDCKKITVWSSLGRDQAQIINRLIQYYFTPSTGISVDLQLVKPEVILPSTVAGNGPDIILQTDQQTPVNFAIRNAAVDLTQFEEFEELASQFRESALTPVTFNDGIYALPETETFPIMFYRKDILKELAIEVPNTWEDILSIIPSLQKNNMSIGIDTGISNQTDTRIALNTFSMFLYQRGGQLYEADGIRTLLDEELAIETFKFWCNLYTNYGLPTAYSDVYRFRTGETPIMISDLETYNKIIGSAPEIKGLWGMATVPGTIQADGSINKSVVTKTTNTLMTTTAKDKQAAWEFLMWWQSSETQELYARELESIIGTAARYMTANKSAFENMQWSTSDLAPIKEQLLWTKGLPEVAGGYFTPRHLNNAFRAVVISKAEPRDEIITYAGTINEELTEKRREFGLSLYSRP